MCIIPYATQEGEISFCAYNTGIGWRNIIEKMHMTATLTKWYEEHGRHEIFAGGKSVPLTEQGPLAGADAKRSSTADVQHDLDDLGIAKNAREEKIRARDAKLKEAQENERMAKLYRAARAEGAARSRPGADRQHRSRRARPAPDARAEARRRARRSRQLRRLVLVPRRVGSSVRLPALRLFPSQASGLYPVDNVR